MDFAKTIFEQGYDSDGLRADSFNEENEIELCEKYNSIKVCGGGALCELPVMEALAPQDTFVLISNDKIKKMKVGILRKELKIRVLGQG